MSAPGPEARVTVLIDERSGSRELLQRVFVLRPGASADVGHAHADDVLYVAQGMGRLWRVQGGDSHELRPGVAALIPWRVTTLITNLSHEELEVVSVLSPPPFHGFATLGDQVAPLAVLHEDEQEDLPAGGDRHFRLLIEPRHGARNVTQFVGFIDRSRAPFHTHTYEEAIYILEGEGIVHIEGHADTPIRPGTSIFLPPGTPHCLENQSDGVLKLLGVFSPPGSPAARTEGR